jgi:hypothetical protein
VQFSGLLTVNSPERFTRPMAGRWINGQAIKHSSWEKIMKGEAISFKKPKQQ